MPGQAEDPRYSVAYFRVSWVSVQKLRFDMKQDATPGVSCDALIISLQNIYNVEPFFTSHLLIEAAMQRYRAIDVGAEARWKASSNET